jgi:calcineurin-like phosphoesterase family protein
MIYFSADQHFGHTNIIKYCERPFENTFQMDKQIIENWNNIITKEDTVYVLGDFSLHSKPEFVYENYIQKLKGNIIFVYEKYTHDKWFDKVYKNNVIKINIATSIHLVNYEGIKIFCTHCPLYTWPAEYHGSIHLHGHSHGNSANKKNRHDVGVDVNNFKPVSIVEIMKILESKEN